MILTSRSLLSRVLPILSCLLVQARGDLTVKTYDDLVGSNPLKPISTLMALTPTATGVETGPIKYDTYGGKTFVGNLPGLTNEESFAVLWTGWFDVTKEGWGTYTFGANSDDCGVVYVDLNNDGDFDDPGELIVDGTGWHTELKIVGSVALNMDAVRIAIGHSQSVGGRVMDFRYRKGSGYAFDDMYSMSGSSGHFHTTRPPAKSTVANLWAFGVPGSQAVGSDTSLVLTVPYGTDVTKLKPTYTISDLATCDKASGSEQNFSGPVAYTVTAGDGVTKKIYTITVRTVRSWLNNDNGLWGDPTNWGSLQVPTGTSITAGFDGIDITEDRTVSLDSSRTVGNLVFGDTSPASPAGWVINDNNAPANVLTLAGTSPTITVNALGTGKDATISTKISGTAGLNNAGPGTLTLTNSGNDYSGETRIMEGVLRFGGSSGKPGSGAIANYGTLLFDCTGSLVVPNVITSPGNVLKNGSGTVVLSGTNSIHGEVTVNGGTLAVDGNQSNSRIAFGSHLVTVNNADSTFEIRGASSLQYPFGIAVNAGAILRIVSGGSTAIGAAGQSRAQILSLELNGGIVDLAYSGAGSAQYGQSCVFASITVGGSSMSTIRFGAGATSANAGVGFTGGWQGATFQVNDVTAGTDLTVSAQIEGNGFTKAGAGTMVSTGDNISTTTSTVSEGVLELSGNNSGATGGIVVNGGVAQFDSLASINGSGRSVTVNSGGTVAFGSTLGVANISAALNRIVTTSAGTVAVDNNASANFNFSAAGLSAVSLGAVGDVIYAGTLTPSGGNYRLGGGGGTLTVTQPLTAKVAALTVNGNVNLRGVSDFSGNTTVNSGTLRLEDNAQAKFVVTDSSNNRITGVGTVVLNGDFLIDTSAVNVTSRTWPLVEVGGFKQASFGTSFTVVGFTPSADGVTWTKNEPTRAWFFSEATGYLTVVRPAEIVVEEGSAGLTDGGSVNFGNVVTGSSVAKVFTLSNTGELNLTGLALAKEGEDVFAVSGFGMSQLTSGMPQLMVRMSELAPGESTTITVTCSPVSTGLHSAIIHIASNDSDESPFDITVTCNGVLPPREVYDQWALDNTLAGGDAEPEAVPFKDGVNNLLKHAFNMNGAGCDRRNLKPGTGTAGLPSMTLDRSGGVLRLEFLRRKNSALIYLPQQSAALDVDSWQPMTGSVKVIDAADLAWERVTVEQPYQPGGSPGLFYRVKVLMP